MSNAKPTLDKICSELDLRDYSFVETGSFMGDTIQLAVDKGFKEIHSIEQSQYYIDHCIKRFSGSNMGSNITLWPGDSKSRMKEICAKLDNRAVFWLDAHFDGGKTAGDVWAPLYHELLAISCFSKHKDNIIMIDDYRHVRDGHYKVDKECVEFLIRSINPLYEITFENGHKEQDVLLAVVRS